VFERNMEALASLSGHMHASAEVIRRLILASVLESGHLHDIEGPLSQLAKRDAGSADALRRVLRQLALNH
jgi:hypothetical protein